jgi:alkanesulfonate monooxygenase SsuD/methylene tetrahydromethanopterin reductase-like flavin-dependent oxidoreductase (luciferase family)
VAERGVLVFGGDVLSCARIAKAADSAGIDTVWTGEFYSRSATITMAAMAVDTSRCGIGASIAWGVGRTPVVTVAEARDLDLLSGGRVLLGLGNGTRRMMADWQGIADTSAPAVRMEELVTVVRKLFHLHEGPVSHEGRFYRVDLKPTAEVPVPLRDEIPIYTAGVQPRMMEVAGRVSDGLLLHPIVGLKYIDEVARPAIEKGALKTGRDPSSIRVVASPICAINENREQARREAAAQIAFYTVPKSYERAHEVNGFTAEAARIREKFAAGDLPGMIDEVTDEMVDTLAAAGTPEEVRSALRRYDDSVDQIQLYSPSFSLTDARIEENTMSLIEHCASVGEGDGT